METQGQAEASSPSEVDAVTVDTLGVIDMGDYLLQPYNYVDPRDIPEALDPNINLFFEMMYQVHKEVLSSRLPEITKEMGLENAGGFEYENEFTTDDGTAIKYLCIGQFQHPQFQGMPCFYHTDSIFEIHNSTGIYEHLIPYKTYILGGNVVHVAVKDYRAETCLQFQQYREVRMTFKDSDESPPPASVSPSISSDEDALDTGLAALVLVEVDAGVEQACSPQAE